MKYTVTWLEEAQNHLARIWNNAPDQQAVADAANAIDKELARSPGGKGTAVSEGLRSLHVPPLHVLFSVRDQDRLVEVASVRRDALPVSGAQTNGQE
jgi:plasmid stabilization system protein ParE